MGRSTWILMDIGNSTTRWAIYSDHRLCGAVNVVDTHRLKDAMQAPGLAGDNPFFVASVVPDMAPLFGGRSVQFVDHRTIAGLQVAIDCPEEVGADRLVNALAAYRLVNGPVLVVDSGTALTFCYVDGAGNYQGGQILPGMRIASQSLHDYTAKVPLIWVEPVSFLTGKSTRQAVQSGLFHGYRHAIVGIIESYRQMVPDIQVVGTGAGLEVFDDQIGLDHYDPDLIFKGLSFLVGEG